MMGEKPASVPDTASVSSASKHSVGLSEISFNTKSGSLEMDDFDEDLAVGKTEEPVDMVNVGQKEDEAVAWSRFFLSIVLLIAVSSMATATYVILRNENEADFESQFRSHTSEIDTILREKIDSAIRTVEQFGVTISSAVKNSNESWPFFTVRDFEAQLQGVIELTHAHTASVIPLVHYEQRERWFEYYNKNIYGWLQESIDFHGLPMNATEVPTRPDWIDGFPDPNSTNANDTMAIAWQVAPFFNPFVSRTNFNLFIRKAITDTYATAEAIRGTTMNFIIRREVGLAESQVVYPFFEEESPGKDKKGKLVSSLWFGINWHDYFEDLLPEDTSGIIVVLKSDCDPDISITYLINGTKAEFHGDGDTHDPSYDYLEVVSNFVKFEIPEGVELPDGTCVPSLKLHMFPSDEYKSLFDSNEDIIYVLWVVLIFAVTSFVFMVYDTMVRKRQKKVMARILRQHKIVSNMFPARFRDKLYDEDSSGRDSFASRTSKTSEFNKKALKSMAELYPSATVMFADISGFTAWSSTREPFQVFTLLENIYMAFDQIALHHGVFKVETVGDCYVAVAGLPDPREDHALAIAAFARNCVQKMNVLTKELEVHLGPDTGDLSLRVGINSGQVTAGVLRGERSRFQLFGDTVNTAARMEATGEARRIQLSERTANMLRDLNRGHWIKARKDMVDAKGKGEMQTYWLMTKEEQQKRRKKARESKASKSLEEMKPLVEGDEEIEQEHEWDEECSHQNFPILGLVDRLTSKKARLVEWNVDVLGHLLKQIIAGRGNTSWKAVGAASPSLIQEENQIGKGGTVLEEFEEIISLPKIGVEELKQRVDPQSVELDATVVSQLRDLITRIASMYRENFFHNFEHASHVTSSVRKLLSRIVSHGHASNNDSAPWNLVDLSGHSYGITSDPLTQFAVVFSAVIHDADHPGVTNVQLVKEKGPLAARFKEKSVAEQNSVVLVWDLLMEDKYRELRSCIYTNEVELRRFRQLVVNTVMATDICDKELGALRKARWNKAFAKEALDKLVTTPEDDTNRKATIVIEHLIQASDVSHTMQHWAVYKKWNERFFSECYEAYKAGRADSDPSVGWYKGEIGFFDFYVIPLAKKLESCGVFGVSSHEYLDYALCNRDEWVQKGEAIVEEYLENMNDIDSKLTSETESWFDDSGIEDGHFVSTESILSRNNSETSLSC